MNKFIYKGIVYNSKKELRDFLQISRVKFEAKIRDKEIILITNTGDTPYDNNNEKQ